jgi:neuron navigator 2
VDRLAFDVLVPKSIVERYVSLLMEHCRIILCGSTGTGKTFLARKLAEHIIRRLVLGFVRFLVYFTITDAF